MLRNQRGQRPLFLDLKVAYFSGFMNQVCGGAANPFKIASLMRAVPFLKSGDFPYEITVFHDGQLADGRERSLLGTASRFPRRDPASLDAIAWYWAQGCYISICTPLIFHYEKEIGHREGFLRFVLHGYLLHLC